MSAAPITRTELIARISEAIATQEGFYLVTSRAKRNHNPGNLRSWGNMRVVDGFAWFPSDEAGWEALKLQVAKNVKRGLTLREFFAGKAGVYPGYAPSSDSNDPLRYAQNVSQRIGIGLDVVLAEACL